MARDPGFMLRLSWHSTPRQRTDWKANIESIAAEHDLAVFCDTSAFADDAPPALWEALLGEPGRHVITERVREELQPWLDARPDHPVAQALREAHPALGSRPEPAEDEPGRAAFDYYTQLLALRRRALVLAASAFQEEQGRDPGPGERAELADWVQRELGERGRLLATKSPGRGTDEALVYLAVEHAITTGKQTLIVTRDADVEEQFFKLIWLIDTHYRAMLLADDYAARFGSYRAVPVPDTLLEEPYCPFESRDAVLIARSDDLVELLPPEPHCVAVSCWNAGTYSSHLSFMAEKEMGRLLRIKDATGGLSTDRLGGRNLHVWTNPFRIPGHLGDAAIVHDRRLPIDSSKASIAMLDTYHALMPCERHKRLVKAHAHPGVLSWIAGRFDPGA